MWEKGGGDVEALTWASMKKEEIELQEKVLHKPERDRKREMANYSKEDEYYAKRKGKRYLLWLNGGMLVLVLEVVSPIYKNNV